MIGIRATATIEIPVSGAKGEIDHWKIQKISTAGLWGIESDSDKEYFKQVGKEELESLKDLLNTLNVDLSNFEQNIKP